MRRYRTPPLVFGASHMNVLYAFTHFLSGVVNVTITMTTPSRHRRESGIFPDDIDTEFSAPNIHASLHLRRKHDVTDDVPVVLMQSGRMVAKRVDSLEVQKKKEKKKYIYKRKRCIFKRPITPKRVK